jgi:hypothetical protein
VLEAGEKERRSEAGVSDENGFRICGQELTQALQELRLHFAIADLSLAVNLDVKRDPSAFEGDRCPESPKVAAHLRPVQRDERTALAFQQLLRKQRVPVIQLKLQSEISQQTVDPFDAVLGRRRRPQCSRQAGQCQSSGVADCIHDVQQSGDARSVKLVKTLAAKTAYDL